MFIHAMFGTIFLLLFITAIFFATSMWWLPFSILIIIAISATRQHRAENGVKWEKLHNQGDTAEGHTRTTELTVHTLDEHQPLSDI